MLRALSAGRDVHLFLLHPSPQLWQSVADKTRDADAVVRRSDDPTAPLATKRLLASRGRDARELQLVVGGGKSLVDEHHPVEKPGDTLLGRIQSDVRTRRIAHPHREEPLAKGLL